MSIRARRSPPTPLPSRRAASALSVRPPVESPPSKRPSKPAQISPHAWRKGLDLIRREIGPRSRTKAALSEREPPQSPEMASNGVGEPQSPEMASSGAGEPQSPEMASSGAGEPESPEKTSSGAGEPENGEMASNGVGEPQNGEKTSNGGAAGEKTRRSQPFFSSFSN